GYCVTGLYSNNFVYGSGNTVSMGWAADGVFANGSQIELTNAFNYAVGYQHYWNPQWRTAVVGGQAFVFYDATAQSLLGGTFPGTTVAGTATSVMGLVPVGGFLTNCNPNFSQSALSTRTAWNPHPFLEIGLDLIWYHLGTANAGGNVFLSTNGARPAGVYQIANLDAYMMVLRFQKN